MPVLRSQVALVCRACPVLLYSLCQESPKSPVQRVFLLSWFPLYLRLPTAGILPSPYLFLSCGVAVCSGKGSPSQWG